MANMALNIEQRLGQKLTNEQQLLWNYMLQRWSNLIFTPLVYEGALAGSEFLVYAANKLYLAYELDVTRISGGSGGPNPGYTDLADETNILYLSVFNNSSYWDATAAAPRYALNHASIKNVTFSRMAVVGYSHIKFIGYRLTI